MAPTTGQRPHNALCLANRGYGPGLDPSEESTMQKEDKPSRTMIMTGICVEQFNPVGSIAHQKGSRS